MMATLFWSGCRSLEFGKNISEDLIRYKSIRVTQSYRTFAMALGGRALLFGGFMHFFFNGETFDEGV